MLKEEKLRGRPGYEHLNEQLHILIEADLPANVVDMRLRQAQEIIEELLKPVVLNSIWSFIMILFRTCNTNHSILSIRQLIYWCLFLLACQLANMQDESQDFIKRQQLRELALLNSNFREDSPGPSGSVSPFNTSGMKRAKTGR